MIKSLVTSYSISSSKNFFWNPRLITANDATIWNAPEKAAKKTYFPMERRLRSFIMEQMPVTKKLI